jgi:hypothetical protein
MSLCSLLLVRVCCLLPLRFKNTLLFSSNPNDLTPAQRRVVLRYLSCMMLVLGEFDSAHRDVKFAQAL